MQRQTTDTTLPDGWERVDPDGAPYHKYLARDAVTVRNHDGSVRFHRDVVVIVTENGQVGVTKGPCYRNSWPANDPDAAGRRLARELAAWIGEGRGPYGDDELEQRLENAVLNSGETA